MESEQPTSTALVRKRSDMELMPPPPPAKRIKRPKNVLDEDTYTEALSKIIARDFFPGLLESETQQEYLDALESKDQEWIAIASRRLKHVMTPGRRSTVSLITPRPQAAQTPKWFIGDTPASTAPSVGEEKAQDVDTNMSLAAFQSRYTSEDNESFYKLLDRQNQKKVEKYAWLWTGNKLPSKMQIKQKEVEMRLTKTRVGGDLTDDGYEEKDRLAIRDKDDDDRPAAPDLWKWKPRNSLMFHQDGIQDHMETLVEKAEAVSRAPPREIVYKNTRAPDPNIRLVEEDRPSRPPSPTLSAVRDAIAGRPRAGDRDSAAGSRFSGETPRVNGYAYVEDEDPEPEASRRPIPMINLGPGDAVPNPFQIQERRKRENLHHRMVDRIAESHRTSARLGMVGKTTQTSIPKFPNSPKVSGEESLTPAAQRLWSNLGTGSSGRRGRATPFDGKVTARSTPKVTPRSKAALLKKART